MLIRNSKIFIENGKFAASCKGYDFCDGTK